MRPIVPLLAAAALMAGGCTAPSRPQEGPGATHVGSPVSPMSPRVDEALLAAGVGPDRTAIQLPDRITLPASYRLVLLDGHFALVRETNAQALDPAPASMRIVTGEIARGELAYQPGLLPQELAAEVAANRESSARMDNALEAVMRRSRELSEQAMELQAQSRKLAEALSAAQSRVQELEAASRAAAQPAPAGPGPREQQD
jgi:hypothetical protein